MECALEHADYPLWCAHLIDVLEEHEWDLKSAAAFLGRSTTSLLKLLARDPALWQFANREREKRNKTLLRK